MTRPTLAIKTRDWKTLFICCTLVVLLAGCASIPTSKPLPPTVEIADVKLVKLGFSQQELDFTLDVFNPNHYNLPVNTLEFVASSDEQAIANGSSQQPVLLVANANTQVVIRVQARANRALRKLLATAMGDGTQLDYNVAGFVKLDNWPARIPFNIDKSVELD